MKYFGLLTVCFGSLQVFAGVPPGPNSLHAATLVGLVLKEEDAVTVLTVLRLDPVLELTVVSIPF